ncbi:hypothetical protein [Klebsiella quasipneumoniae]|uniref:hypothetical protein n=1 Tax=Klebsiella quasipneumoniae TaxID=1463165 RepID=UPI001C272746|nr:hypothetical protein [Klebsiella quasipneumoniae]MBU8944448.1 hypothetical protein [Klebsiella quasipneumoniae]
MTLKSLEEYLIIISLLFFLIFEFFAGPLRWIFHMVGLEVLFSLPKALIIVTQFVTIANVVYKKKMTTNGLIGSLVLAYVIIVSLINSDLLAILVALWGIIPIFLGYHSARIIFSSVKDSKTNTIVYIIFLVSCAGVFINIIVDYPWYDVSYQIAGMDVSSAEIGTTGGYTRYAGFLKSSLQASSNIFIVLLYIIASTKNKLFIFLCFALSLLVSVVTISKTTFALHLILLFYIFVKFLPVKILWRGTLFFAVIATMLTIISTNYSFEMNNDPLSVMLLGSLNARLTITWPNSIEAIQHAGNLFFGGGLGTLGVGSKLGYGYNPGDSMYLYIVATGGFILGTVLVLWSNYQSSVLNNSAVPRFLSMTLIVLCLFGVSMTAPEYPLMGLALGMVFNARAFKQLN